MIDENFLTWVRDNDFLKGFLENYYKICMLLLADVIFLTFANENRKKMEIWTFKWQGTPN